MANLIFDLDNTLYPRHPEIEAEFGIRTKEYLSRMPAAGFMDKEFDWIEISTRIEDYLGRIFAGREQERCAYLDYVCRVNVKDLAPNPELNTFLKILPDTKYIFTDSTLEHVKDTLNVLGIELNHFTGIFGNKDSGFRFKSNPQCHRIFLEKYGLDPRECYLFDDNPRNLLPAAQQGIKTVLISGQGGQESAADYQFSDVLTALKQLF